MIAVEKVAKTVNTEAVRRRAALLTSVPVRATLLTRVPVRAALLTRVPVRAALLTRVSVLAALALACGCANAGAVIVHLNGKALGYQPPSSAYEPLVQPLTAKQPSSAKKPFSGKAKGKLLEYHGGPVMTSNTDYALYWDPSGAPTYPAGYESGIDRYFEDLAHDSGGLQNTDSVLAQYGDSAGEFANYDVTFGGARLDTDPYPANGCTAAPICLTDQQLRTEIIKYTEANGLPMDLSHEYFVLTPPGVESCFEAAGRECSAGTSHAVYCSYHGYILSGKAVIVYANIPYMDGTNCDYGEEHPNDNPSDATIGGGLAHEHSESVTDPELNAWYDAKEEEVADKCRTFKEATEYGEPLGIAPDGAKYNEVIDGDLYYYQQMWSNEAGACVQRAGQAPSVTKITPKSGPAAGGTTVTITGAHFTEPVTVKFGAAAGTEVHVASTTSLTVVSPAGSSASTVYVTVTNPFGTSSTTNKARFKYKKSKPAK